MYSDEMIRSNVAAKFVGTVFLSLLLNNAFLVGEDLRYPNTEDLRHIKGIASPLLSPDGKQVLFTLTDATADGAKSHLWVVSTTGGAARQLTYSAAVDKRGEHNAAWAPGGDAVLFLAKRGETTQLFRLPLAGGEAMPYDLKVEPIVDDSKEKGAIPPAKADSVPALLESPKPEAKPDPVAINISGFALSPDGKWLAFWAADPETPGEKRAKEAKADAVWVDHERHGDRLYLAALKEDGTINGTASTTLKPLALAPDVKAASWSPRSDRLVAVTELPNQASDLGPASTGWLISTSSAEVPLALKGIPATVGDYFGWSPDGTEVAFAAQSPDDAPPGYEELFAMALPATEPSSDKDKAQPVAQRLTVSFDGTISGGNPIYLSDGKVLVAAETGTRLTAVRLALDGKAVPEVVTQATPVASGITTNRTQTGWVWLAQGSDRPQSICFAAKLGGDCQALPAPELTTQHFKTAKSILVQWQNDGLSIEGLLYLPQDIDASKKVPLIVDIHGGPLGAWADSYAEWTNFLIGHGWAVFRPNVRGSSGYGLKFAAANKNDLGGGDFRDVMTGIDAVLKSYPVDPDKLALMGYSYGGEMAGFAEGKTDRFKAIISGAPVIDQMSEYGTEHGSWYDRWYFGKPWEHVEDAWRQSPLSGVAKAKTPFLLLQGEADVTDPLGQAQEMYRALRQAGVAVDLVTYPREDHGPLARGIFGFPVAEPWHGFDGRQRIVEFVERAFKSEASPQEPKPAGKGLDGKNPDGKNPYGTSSAGKISEIKPSAAHK